jgi:hypothetical protein
MVGATQETGGTTMKSLIALAVVAAFALGHAIAAMPGAAASMRTFSAAQSLSDLTDQ